jgi:hypothetical protein
MGNEGWLSIALTIVGVLAVTYSGVGLWRQRRAERQEKRG